MAVGELGRSRIVRRVTDKEREMICAFRVGGREDLQEVKSFFFLGYEDEHGGTARTMPALLMDWALSEWLDYWVRL